jgi:SpoVK/Ycf46/Vps4 family AAA+-type ATPase
MTASTTRTLVQYVRHGSGYQAISYTTPSLNPGYYDIALVNGVYVFTPKPLTTDALIRLSDTKSDEVVREIEHFWTLKDRFRKFGGLIHKRGFLLYGPPGSGKTSTIATVSKRMIDSGGVVVNGASIHPQHLRKALHEFREVEPDRSLIVTLEDIDSILKMSETELLSLLDGEGNIGNVVFIATTNYPEKLEARVVNRPSRFDQVVRIGMPSRDARYQYIVHCDPEISAAEAGAWLDLTDGFSVAQLKEVIINVRCFGHDAEETVHRLKSSGIDALNEKRTAKKNRDRTFFEKFYEICESKLPPEQIKTLRDTAVGAVVSPVVPIAVVS